MTHVSTELIEPGLELDARVSVAEDLVQAVRQATQDGRCSLPWGDAVERFLVESARYDTAERLYLAHLLHRCLRAEVNIDAAAPERLTSMRAPDLEVAPDALGGVRIPLTTQVPDAAADFAEIVRRRKSTPMFDEEPLRLADLGNVLALAAGSKGQARAYQRRDIPRRVFPSAGGLQSFDIQVVVNSVGGLERGRYAYDPLAHELVLREAGDFRMPLKEAAIATDWLLHTGAVLVVVANYHRLAWKYGTRGYRYMAMDAGVVCGQVYLAATALDLAVNAVAAFFDDALNDLVRVDGKDQFTQLLIGLGNRPRPRHGR